MKVFFKPPLPSYSAKEVTPSLVTTTKVVDGVNVCEFVETKVDSDGLTYDDFSIKNLIDAGATDLLKPCVSSSPSRLDSADLVESAIDSFVPEYQSKNDSE